MLCVITDPVALVSSNQEKVTFDLVSLVIVLCSFLSADLIIVQEVLLWRFNCCSHKSSFDQLTFTYWKCPMQLSKQFFSLCCYFFLFHCLCLCHPSPPPPSLSLSPSLSLHFFRLISPFLYIFFCYLYVCL